MIRRDTRGLVLTELLPEPVGGGETLPARVVVVVVVVVRKCFPDLIQSASGATSTLCLPLFTH